MSNRQISQPKRTPLVVQQLLNGRIQGRVREAIAQNSLFQQQQLEQLERSAEIGQMLS
jgi:hypothetical protein